MFDSNSVLTKLLVQRFKGGIKTILSPSTDKDQGKVFLYINQKIEVCNTYHWPSPLLAFILPVASLDRPFAADTHLM